MSLFYQHPHHNSLHDAPRLLYDQDFLDMECPRDVYDPDTAVDNLFWTYLIGYCVAGISMLVALVLSILLWRMHRLRSNHYSNSDDPILFFCFAKPHAHDHNNTDANVNGYQVRPQPQVTVQIPEQQQQQQQPQSSSQVQPSTIQEDVPEQATTTERRISPDIPSNLPPSYYALLIAFFSLQAFGFGAVAANHQFVSDKNEDDLLWTILSYVSMAFMGFSSWIWIAVALLEYHVAIKCREGYDLDDMVKAVFVVLAVGAVTATLVLDSTLILAAVMVLSIAAIVTTGLWQYVRYRHALFLSDVIAALVYLAAIVFLAVMDPLCGTSAYKDCFEDCPLPNPDEFNHRAIFYAICSCFVIQYGSTKIVMLVRATASPIPAENAPPKETVEPSELL